MAALWPVPSRTTAVIIRVSTWAVSGVMTWRTTRGSMVRTVRPWLSSTARTIVGCMRRPSLAMAAKALTIWSAVTEIS